MSAQTPSDPSRAPAAGPDAAWRRVPADLGKRVDHYLYGRRPIRDAGRRRRLRNFAVRRRVVRALALRRRRGPGRP
ncbi:MAG: hypothetical protein IPP10_15205 [Candidatus Competibacteraceae bacterium]|nr:hypothetical protein [Candidatus Competibacteraceae bacterium]MBK8896373.1 hypothetical protein [Candidatus Competibacteraceae bacterium]MBK8964248.1 hypothetical protein [Candidatus Competibacteraceae bacterium]MBK9952797.1 hypothetical protein [Candidatus Competibacteraceae bacterium]